jgi:hypothetical protein
MARLTPPWRERTQQLLLNRDSVAACSYSVISWESRPTPDHAVKLDADRRFAIVIDQRTAPRFAVEQCLGDRVGGD